MISKVFTLLASSCLLGSAFASPQFFAGVHPVAPAHVISSYHSQNELGEYSYGYSGGPSAKQETKTADGITQGGYSYVDAYGLPQSVSYVSDPVHGFRASGTNFPVPVPAFVGYPGAPGAVPISEAVAPAETPEVVAAKAHHFAEKHAAAAAAAATPEHYRRRRDISYTGLPFAHAAPLPYAANAAYVPYAAHAYPALAAPVAPVAYAAPAAYAVPAAYPAYAAPVAPVAPIAAAYAAPVAAVAPVAVGPSASQYHSQNELGEYKYGYANQDSAKEEVKTADGITRGSYSYRDSHGLPQSVSYIADPVHGFRAAGTNLPLAPIA